MKSIFLLLPILLASGCSIRQAFQPPPLNYEVYEKSGANQVEVMTAMLECGYEDPLGILHIGRGSYEEQKEKIAFAEACMIKDGFGFSKKGKTICSGSPQWKACKPENSRLIPERDINRRLESPYCKSYPKAKACQS